MECVIIIGIQGSRQSTFFKSHFGDTRVRVHRDMLKSLRQRRAAFYSSEEAKMLIRGRGPVGQRWKTSSTHLGCFATFG